MIAYNDPGLHNATRTRLARLQANVDAAGAYEACVSEAKRAWRVKSQALFQQVRERLALMTSGNRRCVYCEDSLADEIEHIRPKDLYPHECFSWANYVFACGPCNGPKNNRFAVVDARGDLVDVTRRRSDPVVPPLAGQFALIDPRADDPLDLLWLDFELGLYSPNYDDPASLQNQRARYTIDLLGLNRRDDLVRGRRSAYLGFIARVNHYIAERDGIPADGVARMRESLRAERYRGVWERMKRARHGVPQLAAIFATVPEVLNW